MALSIEDAQQVSPLQAIDRFRATIARLGIDEPVRLDDSLATTFAQLATAVDDRHRAAERRALAALARGDTDSAVRILRAASEGTA